MLQQTRHSHLHGRQHHIDWGIGIHLVQIKCCRKMSNMLIVDVSWAGNPGLLDRKTEYSVSATHFRVWSRVERIEYTGKQSLGQKPSQGSESQSLWNPIECNSDNEAQRFLVISVTDTFDEYSCPIELRRGTDVATV